MMFKRLSIFLQSSLRRVLGEIGFEPPPESATSLLFDGEFVFLGSCFAYFCPHVFLTAAHCIRGRTSSTLLVSCGKEDGPNGYISIGQVIVHPTADLAVLIADAADSSYSHFVPHSEVIEVEAGDEVHAYGFHEDTSDHGMEPLDRYFHGVAQRLFIWDVQKPYIYDAIELSFGAPPGLSGAPLYKSFVLPRTGTHRFLVGMVTANREATTHLGTITEVQNGDRHYAERIHYVTNYGIALNLSAYTKWLTKICKSVQRNKNRATGPLASYVTTA